MSTLKEFTNNLADCINHRMQESGVHATVQVVRKNNGIEKIGIVIMEKDKNVSAVVETAGFQLEYERGITMDEVADHVYSITKEHRMENIDLSKVTDYEKVKPRLALKLINRKTNEELLKNMPYMNVCDDLACICYIALEEPAGGRIMVHYGLLKNWNVTVTDLMRTAMENTELMYPADVFPLEKIIEERGIPIEEDAYGKSIYVVTHEGRVYGAVAALYKGVLNQLAEKLGSDLIIIPSSVHEVLVLPKDESYRSAEIWNRMVREVNETQLEGEEVLSDHIYLYCKETKDICGLVA